MQKGKVVETGTHDSLLQDPEGVYYSLVHAQQLSLGAAADENEVEAEPEEDIGQVLSREKSAAKSDGGTGAAMGSETRNRSLFASFIQLLYEQKSRFPYYILTVLFAMLCAGEHGNPH